MRLLLLTIFAIAARWHCNALLQPPLRRISRHVFGAITTGSVLDQDEPFLSLIKDEPWRGGLEPATEHPLTEIPSEDIEGAIPPGLEGTLLRNGPGRIRFGKSQYGHWFDGDGMVMKAVFSEGKVFVQNRFVRTEIFKEQERTRNPYPARRAWTQAGGGGLKHNFLKAPLNPANTNVQEIGGRLFALCEGGPPVELDPVTLETLGNFDFGGCLDSAYSAHPSIDPETGDIYNFGSVLKPPFDYRVMRISAGGEVQRQSAVGLGAGLRFLHDNAISGRYLCCLVGPMVAGPAAVVRAVLGFKPLGHSFSWEPAQGSQALFFDRETLDLAARIDMPAASHYHIINAFETTANADAPATGSDPAAAAPTTGAATATGAAGAAPAATTAAAASAAEEIAAGTITVMIAARLRGSREELEANFGDLYRARMRQELECDLWRYEFDVRRGLLVSERNMSEVDGAQGFELPTMDRRFVGRDNKYVYVNSLLGDAGWVNGVQVVDQRENRWMTYDPGPGRYAGEPVFVPVAAAGNAVAAAKDAAAAPVTTGSPGGARGGAAAGAEAEEGRGYLLTFVYESASHTSSLVLLDASAVDDGAVCTVRLPFHAPYSFHGQWSHSVYK